MRLGIAADHQGFELKEQLLASLRSSQEIEMVDFGAFTHISEDDYPDFVIPLN